MAEIDEVEDDVVALALKILTLRAVPDSLGIEWIDAAAIARVEAHDFVAIAEYAQKRCHSDEHEDLNSLQMRIMRMTFDYYLLTFS